MKVAVLNQKGEKIEDLTLSKAFLGEVSAEAVTLYVNYLRAALRSPIANTKDRSEVSGGGKKPWKQKGTGNARAGSSRSPLWVHGGVTFGPSNENNFRKRINSREKKRVILGIFADMIRDKKAIFLTDLSVPEAKTKQASDILENVKASGKITVIANAKDTNANISFRNLNGVKPMKPTHLDMIYLMSSDQIVISKDALVELENIYIVDKPKKEAENE